MFLIIAYALLNIVISRFLEKRKWHAAVVAHAVLFIVIPVCMLFLFPFDGEIRNLAQSIFGTQYYNEIAEILSDGGTLVVPVMVVEITLFAMFVTAAPVSTEHAVKFILEHSKEKFCRKNIKKVYNREVAKEKSRVYKIYLRNCRLLC